MLKVASWNVNSLNVRLPHVQAWCAEAQPDILAPQETKLVDEKFPVEALLDAGYHSAYSGQPTYNGVAILSRTPGEDVVTDIPGLDDPQRRILAATYGDVRVIDLYVVNGKEVGSDKFAYKLEWLSRVTDWIAGQEGSGRWAPARSLANCALVSGRSTGRASRAVVGGPAIA